MENVFDILAKEDMDVSYLFLEYNRRKEEGRLYSRNDYVPQNLIKLYYLDTNHLDFKKIIDEFKKKTIYSENEMELVHEELERKGLALVYDDIENGRFARVRNIHVILLIHNVLYSCMPSSSYGGKWRNVNACIADTDVKTTDYNEISLEIQKLSGIYEDILSLADLINKNKSPDLLIQYINKCLYLKCKIIKIHPFMDGNGRTCRALVNMLFKEVGLPPIYILRAERDEYLKAMDATSSRDDFSLINKFYYYKICDSIYELDIVNRKNNGKTK